ncbi:MAG: hypothetical protein ACRCV3_05540 [Desulfovibrionaceae bacterium]
MKVNPIWHKKTSRSPLKRAFFLLVVFLVTGTLFWYNTKNRFSDITAKSSLLDTSLLLSKRQKEAFTSLFEHFEKRYGFTIQLILNPTTPSPKDKQNTLVILIDNTNKSIVLSFPPLLDRALSPSEKTLLKTDLTNALQNKDWINTILLALEHFYFTLEDKKNA